MLCEKPLALTREEIEEMVRVADESGARFMAGQICRLTPAFEKAKEIIESGTIICDNTSPTMTLFVTDEEGQTQEPQTIDIQVNNHNAAKEFDVFADAILNDKPVVTDAREGAKTVAVCLAIVEAATTGKIVKPNYEF